MWPDVHTRPDIAYSVGVLSRYCSNPGPTHCNLVIQIFRYLSGTLDLGIAFTADLEDDLVGYTDSDYVGLTKEMRADGLTKALSPKMFKNFWKMIGMS